MISGILLTQGNLVGARVHIRRALLAGATPREMFQAITVAAIPGGVPVVWQGAPILKTEMEVLGSGWTTLTMAANARDRQRRAPTAIAPCYSSSVILGLKLMRRREYIKLLGGASVAWPLTARAQQGERVRRVGVLRSCALG